MDFEQQQKEAAYAAEQLGMRAGRVPRASTVSGMVGEALSNQCPRQGLKEELASRLIQSQARAGEMQRLARLAELADKNPETFEMLQLMRDCGLWY